MMKKLISIELAQNKYLFRKRWWHFYQRKWWNLQVYCQDSEFWDCGINYWWFRQRPYWRSRANFRRIVYPRIPHHPRNECDFPTQSAKEYFINKKSQYIGDFDALLRNPPYDSIRAINQILAKIDPLSKLLLSMVKSFLGMI